MNITGRDCLGGVSVSFEMSTEEYSRVSAAILDLLSSSAYALMDRAQKEELKKIFHAFLTLSKSSIKSTPVK